MMSKKIFGLLLFTSILFGLKAQEDRKFNFYPNLAVDLGGAIPFPLSDIPEGAGGTPKPYPSLGLGSEFNLTTNWQLAFEINYHLIAFSATADVISQEFNEGVISNFYSGYTETDVELRMVEFPLIAIYKMNKGRRLLFGAYYSLILEGRFETKGIDGIMSPDKSITDSYTNVKTGIVYPYDFNDDLDKYDVGLLIGYSYNLGERMYIWGRLNVGFKSIFEKEFDSIDYDMYQVRINLGGSYSLFE